LTNAIAGDRGRAARVSRRDAGSSRRGDR
jgi:hypothetical protein